MTDLRRGAVALGVFTLLVGLADPLLVFGIGQVAFRGATVLRRTGDVAETVVKAAEELAITQIVLGESHRPRWRELVGQSIIARILRETDGVDVHIIADKKRT